MLQLDRRGQLFLDTTGDGSRARLITNFDNHERSVELTRIEVRILGHVGLAFAESDWSDREIVIATDATGTELAVAGRLTEAGEAHAAPHGHALVRVGDRWVVLGWSSMVQVSHRVIGAAADMHARAWEVQHAVAEPEPTVPVLAFMCDPRYPKGYGHLPSRAAGRSLCNTWYSLRNGNWRVEDRPVSTLECGRCRHAAESARDDAAEGSAAAAAD
jgi:hypothetical protein